MELSEGLVDVDYGGEHHEKPCDEIDNLPVLVGLEESNDDNAKNICAKQLRLGKIVPVPFAHDCSGAFEIKKSDCASQNDCDKEAIDNFIIPMCIIRSREYQAYELHEGQAAVAYVHYPLVRTWKWPSDSIELEQSVRQ